MSESVYLVIIPTMLLFALRCIDKARRWDFVVLGLLIGVATLTRSEAVDFIVLLAIPVVIFASKLAQASSPRMVLLAGIALVIGPWLIRNDIQLGSPTLSTNGGLTLSGSYSCHAFTEQSRLRRLRQQQPVRGDGRNRYLREAAKRARSWTERTLTDALTKEATPMPTVIFLTCRE